MTTTTSEALTSQIADLAQREATARQERDLVEQLAAERSELQRELEDLLAAEQAKRADDYADAARTSLNATHGALVEKLNALATAADEALNAALVHRANVGDVVTQSQHLCNGETAGRIRDNRFGVTIDGRRVRFDSEAVAGQVAAAVGPLFSRLGLGVIGDQMKALKRSTALLSTPFPTEDAVNEVAR
jgi:hypothetical protein